MQHRNIQSPSERKDHDRIDDRLVRLSLGSCLACCLSLAFGVTLPLLAGTELPLGGLAVSAAATACVFALAIAITRFEHRATITDSAMARFGAQDTWQQ